jgi:4-hydroxy-tetrahydrodipicolinate synthase
MSDGAHPLFSPGPPRIPFTVPTSVATKERTVPASAPRFHGLWIPLVTPFADGQLDLPAARRLTRRLCADGISGLIVCGSTGEAAALDADEQLALLDAVMEAAPGIPVVMGLSGYHLPETLQWVRTLSQRPLTGLLVSAPHYIRPGQAGALHWFQAIADVAAAPLILYDIPYRTGTVLERDTLLALAAHPNIAAIKDCGGDAGKTLALIADGRLDVLAGEDLQLFATIAQGGCGAVAASAHLCTAQFAEVIARLRAGQVAEARSIWLRLLPLVEAAFGQPNPGPVKAWLGRQDGIHADMRPPMMPPSAAWQAQMLDLPARLQAMFA